MDIHYFYQLAEKEALPVNTDIEVLKNLVDEYPYFQEAIFIYLKALYLCCEEEDYTRELERLSIGLSDRRALFYYIFSEDYDRLYSATGKKEIKEDKTNILLNAFFESKGENISESTLEFNLPATTLITSDYLAYMQTQEDEPKETGAETQSSELKHQNIIDSFITKSETEGGIRIKMNQSDEIPADENSDLEEEYAENEDELDEDVFFTETLAKIYIRQKKYEKAYKIIKHLSLNYPKKNIYFADQLSFLEKLIINSKHKDKK